MEPIQDLINRIRWDREFGAAEFELGYYDRVDQTIHRIPFQQVHVPEHQKERFELWDADGTIRRIPWHRVKEVYRNGQRIWQRPEAPVPAK
jgi:uncharacterized protein (UPF0248 family)